MASIGDVYGGGKVFWISPDGLTGKVVSHELRVNNCQWWSDILTLTNAKSVDDGKANTDLIIAVQGAGDYAAKVCKDYTGGGFLDWYLPALNELIAIHTNRIILGLTTQFFWSSTEEPHADWYANAYRILFDTGSASLAGKTEAFCVAAIRQVTFTAPLAPILTSPAHNATSIPINPLVTWQASAGATGYIIERATNSAFTGAVSKTMGNFTSNQFDDPNLNYGTTYWWRVMATNIVGQSDWSGAWCFTTIIGTPELISPADNAQNINAAVPLSWTAVAGADSYHISYSKYANFSQETLFQGCVATNQTVIFENGTTYYWRIRAYSSVLGLGGWSMARSFTTIVAVAGVPVLNTPTHLATNVAVLTTFTWGAVTGADSYKLKVGITDGFLDAAAVQSFDGLTGTSKVLTIPLSNATVYHWRMCSTNAGGDSAWSTT